MAPHGKLRNTEQASAYLEDKHGVVRKASTLHTYRSTGGGPEFHKIGRHVGYSDVALDSYAQKIISAPFSSTSAIS